MPAFTDQLGHTITIDQLPQRIISLVPSQTELLYALGLDKEVVGITKFCIHPDIWFRTKTLIGGTKNVNAGAIHSLQPDLILANREENVRGQVQALSARYPTYTTDIHDLPTALDMIAQVAALTGRTEQGRQLINDITTRFSKLSIPASASTSTPTAPRLPQHSHKPRTAYFIWRDPWMLAGGDTFIHDMMTHAGLTNVMAGQTRYPAIDDQTLRTLDPGLVLLSSEPYPFKEQHIAEINTILPNAKVLLVDGEMFSWYGSRLLQSPNYFHILRDKITR